jgi:hypothetical protein
MTSFGWTSGYKHVGITWMARRSGYEWAIAAKFESPYINRVICDKVGGYGGKWRLIKYLIS